MSYQSPIEIIYKQMRTQFEDNVYKAIQDYGIVVDKDELIKALQYDRDQYEKGYADALSEDKWISCEERMPEDMENVLVWFEYFRYGNHNRPYQTHGLSYAFRGNWSGFINGQSGWQGLKIIAWRPLPGKPIWSN
jgi:hypothetical protein